MPAPRMGLLDLPPDVLLRVVAQASQDDRLCVLPLVCKRLRDLLVGPSEAWRCVEVHLVGEQPHGEEDWQEGGAALSRWRAFCRWLARRLGGIEELRLAVDASNWEESADQPALGRLLTCNGTTGMLIPCDLPLAKLSLQWMGATRLRTLVLSESLPCLRKLAFPHGTDLLVDASPSDCRAPHLGMPRLTDFGLIDGNLRGSIDLPWLPPSLTMLVLAAVQLRGLPGVLDHLPRLRSLVLDHNPGLGGSSLARLARLSALQELNLSECALHSFPRQLSALTGLRILYLHHAFADAGSLGAADWDTLASLRRLCFLSISCNALFHLPAVVTGMKQLRGLHIEENWIRWLPPAPFLSNLRELLLDWRGALGGGASLAHATALTRLVLNDHSCPEIGHEGQHPAVDTLLCTLGRLPALQLIEDVAPEQDASFISAPVARALLLLGRACPHARLGTMPTTNAGWTLSSLVAELPHNDGLSLLAAEEGGSGDDEGEGGGGDDGVAAGTAGGSQQ